MEIQRQILLFFAGLHTPLLDALFQAITMFGEEYITVAVITYMYWNVSKRKGFATCMCMLSSLQTMSLAKALVRFPRPWMVIDGLSTVRQSTATGYSFPSGHTTNASATFSSVAFAFRKRWLSVLCAVIIALVGLSRMYLCVHWPLDVAGGLLIGIGTTLLLYERICSLFDDDERGRRVFEVVAIVSTALLVVLAVLLQFALLKDEAFTTFAESVAMVSGAAAGFLLERRCFDYAVEEGHIGRKVLRFAVGILGAVAILPGTKVLLTAFGAYCPITKVLRYALVTFWATGLFPVVGGRIGLFVKAERRQQ